MDGLEMTKTCSRCVEEKPLTEFAVYGGKPWYWCRKCQCAATMEYTAKNKEKVYAQRAEWRKNHPGDSAFRAKAWRDANPDKAIATNKRTNAKRTPEYNRARSLRALYGITVEQYESMYRAQNGTCAICERVNLGGKRLSVDHNHKTGAVRALLCQQCNTAIGSLGERTETLYRAIQYLERFEIVAEMST